MSARKPPVRSRSSRSQLDPRTGVSAYKSCTHLSGVPVTTGLGVADGLKSLMVFTDPSAVGTAAAEVVTKLPLCEDI